MLGPAFSFKCLLGPLVKLHIYQTFVCPVLLSGLSSLVIQPTTLSPLSIFQRKVLKGVLQLSKQASTASIHFLTGELPIEAMLHGDILSLFFSVWANPDLKIHTMVKYLVTNSTDNSWTWSNSIRKIANQYGLEEPMQLMYKDAPSRSNFKNDVITRICAFHEQDLRKNAEQKS